MHKSSNNLLHDILSQSPPLKLLIHFDNIVKEELEMEYQHLLDKYHDQVAFNANQSNASS
ncbi:unnamed protein product [Camellia sinensis]